MKCTAEDRRLRQVIEHAQGAPSCWPASAAAHTGRHLVAVIRAPGSTGRNVDPASPPGRDPPLVKPAWADPVRGSRSGESSLLIAAAGPPPRALRHAVAVRAWRKHPIVEHSYAHSSSAAAGTVTTFGCLAGQA